MQRELSDRCSSCLRYCPPSPSYRRQLPGRKVGEEAIAEGAALATAVARVVTAAVVRAVLVAVPAQTGVVVAVMGAAAEVRAAVFSELVREVITQTAGAALAVMAIVGIEIASHTTTPRVLEILRL